MFPILNFLKLVFTSSYCLYLKAIQISLSWNNEFFFSFCSIVSGYKSYTILLESYWAPIVCLFFRVSLPLSLSFFLSFFLSHSIIGRGNPHFHFNFLHLSKLKEANILSAIFCLNLFPRLNFYLLPKTRTNLSLKNLKVPVQGKYWKGYFEGELDWRMNDLRSPGFKKSLKDSPSKFHVSNFEKHLI